MIFSLFRWWTRGDGWTLICIIIISYLYKYDMIRISLSINRRIRLYIYRSWYESIEGGNRKETGSESSVGALKSLADAASCSTEPTASAQTPSASLAIRPPECPGCSIDHIYFSIDSLIYRFVPFDRLKKCGIKEKKITFEFFSLNFNTMCVRV